MRKSAWSGFVPARACRYNGNDGKEATAVRVVKVNNERFAAPDADRTDGALPADEGEDDLDPQFPIVLVTWHDAWFDFDQQDPEDCRSDYLVRTVGFLVSDGPMFVSVAQEVLPDGDGFRAVTHIPRSIIEQVAVLDRDVVPHAEPPSTTAADGPPDPYTRTVVEERASEGGMSP
jgi:hypothetical protein